jgi:hypothetical protein
VKCGAENEACCVGRSGGYLTCDAGLSCMQNRVCQKPVAP